MMLIPNFNFLKSKKKNNKDNLKPLEWFKSDEDFKSLYNAESGKIDRIVASLANDGFDMTQPIIVTNEGKVIDGNSRLEAVRKYNQMYSDNPITELPYLIKDFESKEDALLYEIHLNTDRRNLKDQDLLTSFMTLNGFKEKLKKEGKETSEYTDKKLSEILNVSGRQISKLRYILKYGTPELVDAIIKGECSINNAESEIKMKLNYKTEKDDITTSDAKETTTTTFVKDKKVKAKKENKALPKIKTKDFMLGVKYAISEMNKGYAPIEIWNAISLQEVISFSDEQLAEIENNLNNVI